MSDNKEQVQRDEEGFIILKRKEQSQTQSEQDPSPQKSNQAETASKKSSKSAHKGKTKPKEKKYTLLYWYYDDGLTRGHILKRGGEYTLPATVNPNRGKDAEKYEKQLEKFRIEKKVRQLKLPVGLKYLAKKHQESILQANLDKSNFEEFLKMVQPGMENTPRQTILRLICTILSSYWIHKIVEAPSIDDYNLDPEELHAFCTSVAPRESAYYALRKIAESVIVDTHVKSDIFKIRTAAELPEERESCSIQDDTFLMVRGYEDEDGYWPAPYRDTAVVLDARKLKKNDIVNFASINPWCSCIVYGKIISIPFRYNESIKGSPLANMEFDWDEEKVHDLVEAYAAEIYGIAAEKFELLWQQAGAYLRRYIDSNKCKMLPAERFRKRAELLVLESFLNFCKHKCAIPEEDFQNTKCTLLNILLPGCCVPPASETVPENSEMGSDTNSSQKYTPQQVFQDILGKMVQTENRRHFLFVGEKETFDRVDPDDPACEYWGYLRMFIPRKNGAEEFPSLSFRQADFEKVALSIAGVSASATELIKSVRKEGPDYLYGVDKGRFPTGEQKDKNTVAAIILDIRKMSFLSEDQLTLLWENFPDRTLQTPPEAEN